MTRLRIALMLESDGPGGAENTLLALAEGLRDRGHSVIHVGPRHGVGWLPAEFAARGFESHLLSPRGPLDPAFLIALRKLIEEQQLNIVHSHEFTMAVYGSVAARMARVRHVITLHGGTRLTAAMRRRVAIRGAIMLSHATAAVSNAWKAELTRVLPVSGKHLAVVHNGVPFRSGKRDETRRALGIRDQQSLLVAVGNLEPWKGHRYLVDAMASLPENVTLILAGGRGGSEMENLQRQGAELGLENRFRILLNRSDVPDLLAASDVFVMPSLFEGLPLAVLEAMFASRAIVASDVGGIPEAISNGQNGILVKPGSAEDLAAALRDLITDSERRARLASSARETADAHFSVSAMVDGYERLYGGE